MRRQHRSLFVCERHSAARACGLALLLVGSFLGASAPVAAAPVEAIGTSSAEGESDRARDRAIAAARKAALEQAIASVDTPVDADAVKQVLARADAWTAAYRVLEIRATDTNVEVRIEVEIDLPRLRKRIAQTSASTSRAGFAWGSMAAKNCPSIDEAAVRDPLRAYGILASDGNTKLVVSITCSDRGAVTHTHVRAAAVDIVAETQGEVQLEVRFSTQGFAEDLAEATKIALDRAVGELADELAVEARGDLELRVERPWPASRVTVLSNSLRDAVLGVDAVELAGIATDGSVILRVGGKLDAHTLGRSLQTASFPGFNLVGLRIDGAHALRVRMQ